MKKLFMILPCLIALCGCDKTKFYENDVKCLGPDSNWVGYGSLDVNSKRAVFKNDYITITMKRYVSEEYPEDVLLYKNETNDLMPRYLHFVDKDHYTVGTDLHHWYECRKSTK